MRPLGIRARLILLGTAGLAAGLGLGGLVLIAVLNHAVQESVTEDARGTGREIVRLVEAGDAPQPLPVSGGQFVQIVDDRHRVVAASANADRLVPMLRESEMDAAKAGRVLVVDGSRAGLAGPLRVVALEANAPGLSRTVIVARPMFDVNTGVAFLGKALLLAYPLMVFVLAVVGWRVAGAALRPVETLRLGAERITGAASDERLPVPLAADEIHRLALTLNDMLARLATSRARQRAFVADAAHELRSPLASMRVQLEVAARLRDTAGVGDGQAGCRADGQADGRVDGQAGCQAADLGDLRGDLDDLTSDLLADIGRLSRLVDDLLVLARGDEVLPVSRALPVDLAGLCSEVVERYGAARVSVTCAISGNPWVGGDQGELARIMINLIDNAVRHASRAVVVRVTEARPYHVLTVTDDGPGIPEQDRERVFDRFTRLDDARTRDEGGSGLGLAIVLGLVRRHGGTVTLGDAIAGMCGSGLRVEVRLPRGEVMND